MKSSRALRRIAWALDMPMTKAMEKIFEYLPEILDNKKVCQGCRDKSKCSNCGFNSVEQNQDRKEVVE
jgi:recombinational DNA repair protein RecR